MKTINYIKACFTILAAIYGFNCARDPSGSHFLDRVNLISHEAGHLLFSYLGEFLMVVGGSVGQLFVPIAFTVYFFLRREFFSSSVTLFWTGQSFFSISVYMKDAQEMALPLVSVGGGDDTIHDWNYIFSKLGLLRWDQQIGTITYSLGVIIIIISIFWGIYHSINRPEESDSLLVDSDH